jgi:hypothetical protein
MHWLNHRPTVRTSAIQRPVDLEDDRQEWLQTISLIPDFDFTSFETSQNPEDAYRPDFALSDESD